MNDDMNQMRETRGKSACHRVGVVYPPHQQRSQKGVQRRTTHATRSHTRMSRAVRKAKTEGTEKGNATARRANARARATIGTWGTRAKRAMSGDPKW